MDRTQPTPRWIAVIFGWFTLNGVALGTQYYLVSKARGEPWGLGSSFMLAMAGAYLWVPVTLAALWLTYRMPLERRSLVRRLAVHIAFALLVPVFRAGVVVLLNPVVEWYAELPAFSDILLSTYVSNFFFYWLIVGVLHAAHYAQRSRQREQLAERLRRELAEAQLRALRSQLQPHFLFNALNTISSHVQHDPPAAEAMIERLSGLLRHTLERAGADEVELAEELSFVEDYLAIEQARYEDRLTVQWRIGADTPPARVPPLILQPLVENAVRHGIAPRTSGGHVAIETDRANGRLRLRVRDDGTGMRAASLATGRGLGLNATRERLHRMYGTAQRFRVLSEPGRGTTVEIEIPFATFLQPTASNGHDDE